MRTRSLIVAMTSAVLCLACADSDFFTPQEVLYQRLP